MRLDKYLAEMGAGTRKEIGKAVRAGRVTVNGQTVKNAAMQVTAEDEVSMDGVSVEYEEYVYYMLNKPAGVISATEDARERTVLDLISERQRKGLFPVGRLDRDTEGLLLITNDGGLAHRLLSPRHHVDKVYYARLDGPVGEAEKALFAQGLKVDETLTALPAELEILEPATEVRVTIREGKFHQVKRMFEAVGREVLYLKRLSMGPLALDESLPKGDYRRLTAEEESAIMNI
ncbi:MAG: rRNA pseudouridine synthase [Lachnospiraceae bacterium]|jgi:16S rRNA pseudouridine516 synthase|nr:rRNA pseudouridine synthase [Lachnospiraceae bacterium]